MPAALLRYSSPTEPDPVGGIIPAGRPVSAECATFTEFRMLLFLLRRWFLVLLVVVIPLGLWLGHSASPETEQAFPKHLVPYASSGLTALILFLMSSTLQNDKLVKSFRSPGPVLWGMTVNFILLPLATLPLLRWQRTEDFRIGLLVATAVPSTLAAASVWTRKAKGNDAISLLVTILSNGICFLVTPLWLQVGLGSTVNLEARDLIFKLFLSALVPITVGQVVRLHKGFRAFADHGKAAFGALAQVCILLIILWGSVQGGASLRRNAGVNLGPGLGAGPVAVVWGSCILLHLAAAAVALWGARFWKFSREDSVAVVFAGSQKTLPIGIFVAEFMMRLGYPFATLPMLMYHSSQLLIDTLFVDPLSRWVEQERTAAAPVSPEPEPMEEV